ncbi:alpha/beta hydrolase [Mesorhizobium sp. M1312]
MSWKLDETVETSAGAVAAGRFGRGPALVLAHGWPWSSFSWHRIIPDLARRYRVHWYDMPGYGRSAKAAEQRTSLDVQGEVFAEMLAHWDLAQPMVVAHDFGGATTLRAHLLHGCDFERYVLMNVVAMRLGDRSSSIMSVAMWMPFWACRRISTERSWRHISKGRSQMTSSPEMSKNLSSRGLPRKDEEASIGNSRKPTKNIPPKSSRRSGISGVR